MVAKLSTRGLTKSFSKNQTELVALKDLTIDVQDGEFVSIVGASGCGKTTFLRLIDGLTKPTSGSIEIDGRTITSGLPASSLRSSVSAAALLPV